MFNAIFCKTKTEEIPTKTEEITTKTEEIIKQVDKLYEEQKQDYYESPQSVSIRFRKNGPEEMYFQNALSNNFTLGISDPSSWSFAPVDKDASEIVSLDMRDCKDNCKPYPFMEQFFD